MRNPTPARLDRSLHLQAFRFLVALVGVAMLLVGPSGVQATTESPGGPRAQPARDVVLAETLGMEEPRWEITAGARHFVFRCPAGYPIGASLADYYADCELLYVYFCLDRSPWQPPLPQSGCDDRRRL